VDAHADINTPESTDTGNLHGCPVSFLLGLTGTNVEPFNKWIKPCLKPSELFVACPNSKRSLMTVCTLDYEMSMLPKRKSFEKMVSRHTRCMKLINMGLGR